jgi:hypothetical protein
MKTLFDQSNPLYGSISYYGSGWSVVFPGSRLSGYGDFPRARFPGLPVIDYRGIDYRGNEAVWQQAIDLPDSARPQYGGPLDSFLDTIRNLGIPVFVA